MRLYWGKTFLTWKCKIKYDGKGIFNRDSYTFKVFYNSIFLYFFSVLFDRKVNTRSHNFFMNRVTVSSSSVNLRLYSLIWKSENQECATIKFFETILKLKNVKGIRAKSWEYCIQNEYLRFKYYAALPKIWFWSIFTFFFKYTEARSHISRQKAEGCGQLLY